MKGLICKDLLSLSDTLKMYIAILLILIAYCVFRGREAFIPLVLILILSTVTSSTFTKDSICHWNKLAVTMPFQKKTIVQSKFALAAIILLTGAFLGAAAIIICGVSNRVSYFTAFQFQLLGICISLCANMISLFVLFRWPDYTEKMELLTVISYILSTALCMGLLYVAGLAIKMRLIALLMCIAVLAIAMIPVFHISVKTFEKADIH